MALEHINCTAAVHQGFFSFSCSVHHMLSTFLPVCGTFLWGIVLRSGVDTKHFFVVCAPYRNPTLRCRFDESGCDCNFNTV